MPRGRQYYDPIIQVPSSVDGAENKERIEVFPIGMDSPSRLPTEVGRWASRRIAADGSIAEQGKSAAQQYEAVSMAQAQWPGLEVYTLTMEIDDSTWDGVGPSPRLWQMPSSNIPSVTPALEVVPTEDSENQQSPPQLHFLTVGAPGVYLRLEDILAVLEDYATQFDAESNPSAALGLREAANALKEAF